ncbi:MAG: CmcJ/NvfI family oxidoreductase [Desulfurellaceae bacterium]|nr:CmcJ/NvfI family oxidoreductase [Desulfurellaceae bacterium]
MKTSSHVNAPMSYLDVEGVQEKPTYYLCPPPAGVPQRNTVQVKHTMAIQNAREHLDEISLDKQGITFTPHETAVENFYDAEEVKAVYYPEVVELIKKMTGAEKVHVFDHNVRCAPMCARGENGAREPVKFAHNDYTLKSGPQRVRDLLPAEEAEEWLQHRFAVINVWRPIRGPVQDAPLAVCDAASMTQDDFNETDLKYEDRTGEVYSVSHNPNHRWFYFPQMERNEAMLLKCYDSATDGRARFTAHSAFEDPTSPPDAPARESIETRTLVFFPPEA